MGPGALANAGGDRLAIDYPHKAACSPVAVVTAMGAGALTPLHIRQGLENLPSFANDVSAMTNSRQPFERHYTKSRWLNPGGNRFDNFKLRHGLVRIPAPERALVLPDGELETAMTAATAQLDVVNATRRRRRRKIKVNANSAKHMRLVLKLWLHRWTKRRPGGPFMIPKSSMERLHEARTQRGGVAPCASVLAAPLRKPRL